MSKTNIEIETKVNELYAKTIVTQRLKNESEEPLELKIYVHKKIDCLFSSFSAKIGDSISVKSKVIKKKKAEIQYTDSISQGNAAIFVSNDPNNENRIIINLGNIPPKEELTFISEFIYFIESSESYEFELFRNIPIFNGKNSLLQDSSIKGKVEIKTKNKINKIEKKILSEKIRITEEKYLDDENKNNYLIKYEYNNLEDVSLYEEYIPSTKIYFDLELNEKSIIFTQNSSLNNKEKCYTIQYRNISKKPDNEEELKLNPSLFIFLIDQSASMYGTPIKVASRALLLFLQSLPVGSYYQIIGFGSNFKKYDKTPKEYISKNIKESIKLIENLDADLGCTDIYSPLKDIYNSYEIYDKINLPCNIFLLTDGEIDNKEDTLAIIEKNSDKFSIYSIGIGNDFDKDLIKNAGIIGKGNYNFCPNIQGLNEVIATEVCNACNPYISNFNIKSNLDEKNLYKMNNINNIIIRKNKICNFNYIIKKNEENNNINKINIEIKYIENDISKNGEKNEIKENYEIIPNEIPEGEELSKIIIYNYLLKNLNFDEEEKIKLSLKYQILTADTSLFAEVELSDKISEEMKIKIIGDKENNVIKKYKPKKSYSIHRDLECSLSDRIKCCPSDPIKCCDSKICFSPLYRSPKKKCPFSLPSFNFSFFKSIGSSIKGFFSSQKNKKSKPEVSQNSKNNKEANDNLVKCEEEKITEKEEEKKEVIEKKEKIDLNKKEDLMKIINTQDFISGFWDINKKTKIIKEIYEKEFESLKKIKDKKIDNKSAMTVLIIYYIHKEHPELLKELVMIIRKAKLYIQEKIGDTYENIIKEINIY